MDMRAFAEAAERKALAVILNTGDVVADLTGRKVNVSSRVMLDQWSSTALAARASLDTPLAALASSELARESNAAVRGRCMRRGALTAAVARPFATA